MRPEQREEVLNDAAGILVRPEQREEVLDDAAGISVRFYARCFLAPTKKSSFLELPFSHITSTWPDLFDFFGLFFCTKILPQNTIDISSAGEFGCRGVFPSQMT